MKKFFLFSFLYLIAAMIGCSSDDDALGDVNLKSDCRSTPRTVWFDIVFTSDTEAEVFMSMSPTCDTDGCISVYVPLVDPLTEKEKYSPIAYTCSTEVYNNMSYNQIKQNDLKVLLSGVKIAEGAIPLKAIYVDVTAPPVPGGGGGGSSSIDTIGLR